MTATAFALDPALDIFDDVDAMRPARPDLRLVHGRGAAGRGAAGRGAAGRGAAGRGAAGRGAAGRGAAGPHMSVLSAPAASVEVYRRRRFLALLAATTLVLAVAWAAGVSLTSFSASSGDAPIDLMAQAVPAIHVVLPGDSYAAIAADLGAINPVAGAELLRVANGGSELVVGQRLVIDAALFELAG